MSDHPEPRSAHPGVDAAHAHWSLLTRGQMTTLTGSSWFPDFSEFQGAIDWDALDAAHRAGTISAVAIRAGFGTVRADAQFATNQREARARGIPAIYYWFNYFSVNTPEAEAAMFNATVGPLQPGEAMCGDFEDDGAFLFPRGAAGVEAARRFLTALRAPQNATWWYTYPYLLSTVGLQPLIGAWPFWIADYSATPDSAFATPIARQFTDCGATPGVGGCCDQSRVLRAPLSQWLVPGILTGGPEVLDPTDPIVIEIRQQLADLHAGWNTQQGELLTLQAGDAAAKAELDALQAAVAALQASGTPPASLQPVLDSIAKLGAHLGIGTA